MSAVAGTRAYLVQQAKDLGVKGSTQMRKADLAEAVAAKLQEHGARRTVGPRAQEASPAAQPSGDFDAQLAELQRIFADMQGGQSQAMPAPQQSPAQPDFSQTNPLLAPVGRR